jgi:sulfopropanediol 3-dehydrogenase
MPKHLKTPVTPKPGSADQTIAEVVGGVISEIERRGDEAVRDYSERFDDWSPPSFRLAEEEIEKIVSRVDAQVVADIRRVQGNVRDFARRQLESLQDFEVETMPGVYLGQRHLPVNAAAAYVPGGRYPLVASAHMTVVTAKVAGVARVAACTPPIRGQVPAATITAMALAGADEIYLLGGVQAVAAVAIGTETIAPVNLIAGPGNAYVAEAKRQLFGRVGIDLFAGPTEILVIADDSADPFIAVDLLSQAEHGPDSPAILVSSSERVAREALAHIESLLPDMPTRDFAGPSWRDHGQVIVTETTAEAFAIVDAFASEHVEVLTSQPRLALDAMSNYGALFLGEGTCVAYGDKVIGTNHTLPTRGAARYTGGLWVGKYMKTVTYQEITNKASSAELGELCSRASRVELFDGHARAGEVRTAKYAGKVPEWITSADRCNFASATQV